MLINSKHKNKIKGFFTLLFLFVAINEAFGLGPTTIKKDINANDKYTFYLNLDEREYVRGEYKLSSNVQSIKLLDEKKQVVRDLYTRKRLEDRFIFITDKKAKYYIEIVTLNTDTTLELNIKKTIPKNEQIKIKNQTPISPSIAKLKNKKDIENFWNKIKKEGTPLIEQKDDKTYILTYLYKGAKQNVKILGAPVAEHVLMDKLANSDIWYKSYEVPNGVRLSYQLAPDVPEIPGSPMDSRIAIVATIQADPLNKTPMEFSKNLDKYNKTSTVVLPNPKYKDWALEDSFYDSKIETFKLKSKILKNERDIDIYKPKNFSKDKHYPILYLFDGKEYQSKVNVPKILDNLITAKKISPMIAVFISNPSYKTRASELPANEKFAKFMSKELVPWVKKNVTKNISAKWSILSGSSYGGLASTYVAFKYPDNFKKVLSMSGSFWWNQGEDEPEWFTREFSKAPKKDIKILLYAGIYETGYFSIDILESNRHLRDVLIAKNYDVSYDEFLGSHDYFSWQVVLPDGLIKLLKDYKE